mgnify:CR=1 FL=1
MSHANTKYSEPCRGGGEHKSPGAKNRCWACSHPDRVAIKPTDMEFAKRLIAEDWRQVSAKGRIVARSKLPGFSDMVTLSASAPPWLVEKLSEFYDRQVLGSLLRTGNGDEVEWMTLTEPQFRAFKRLDGRVA